MTVLATPPVDDVAEVRRALRPVAALFLLYPLWWALGVQVPAWALVALPVGMWVLLNRRVLLLPPGYLALLLFLGWVGVSAIMLSGPRYLAAYGFRLVLYTAVVVIAVAVWNAVHRGLPGRTVVRWLVALWGAAVLLAYPGILVDNLEFTSPLEAALRIVGLADPFVTALTHPEFSEYDGLYGSPRPSALFAYTNDWGAAVGIGFPVAVHALVTARGRAERLLLAGLLLASVPPILVSLNRGCWITIGVAVGYVVVRRAAAGDFRALAAVVTGLVAVVGTVLAVEPVRRVITARFEYGNTSTRATLYEASWGLALRSPLFGWGRRSRRRASPTATTSPSARTASSGRSSSPRASRAWCSSSPPCCSSGGTPVRSPAGTPTCGSTPPARPSSCRSRSTRSCPCPWPSPSSLSPSPACTGVALSTTRPPER
ncbi:O-antigen ligase family protein [Nocardioides zeae]